MEIIRKEELWSYSQGCWASKIWQVLFALYIEKGGTTRFMGDLLVDYDRIKDLVEKKGGNFVFVWAFDSQSGYTDLYDSGTISLQSTSVEDFLKQYSSSNVCGMKFLFQVTMAEGNLTVKERKAGDELANQQEVEG